MERISSLCNDIIENPLGSFLLSNSLSLSVSPSDTNPLFQCVLSRHNKIWSPYSRRDSRVLKRYWRRETPLCDRGQRRDSMSEKKRERVCQSLELMEPSFTKMLIIAVFVCVGLFQQVLSHTQLWTGCKGKENPRLHQPSPWKRDTTCIFLSFTLYLH